MGGAPNKKVKEVGYEKYIHSGEDLGDFFSPSIP